MVKNVILAILLLFVFTLPRVVYGQTPTATPSGFFQVPLTEFQYATYFTATTAWNNPSYSLGVSDYQEATISATGYNPLNLQYEAIASLPPPEWGSLIGVKFDIVAHDTGNLVIYPEHNFAAISGCNGKQVTTGAVHKHYYLFFSTIECAGLNVNMFYDGDFTSKFSHYYGNQPMNAKIDSVSVIPIFTNSPYNSGVKNIDDPVETPVDTSELYEPCDQYDLTCQLRNMWKYFVITFFKLNTQFGQDKYDEIHDAMMVKKPLAYIAAFQDLDFGQAFEASYSSVPDFNLTYANKYKGVQVFETNINVASAVFDPIAPFISKVRGAISWVLYLLLLGAVLRMVFRIIKGA